MFFLFKQLLLFYYYSERNRQSPFSEIAMVSKFVKIAAFETPVEAHIARNALEAMGITATISNESLAGNAWLYGGAIGGVHLHVAAEDAEAALKFLSEHDSSGDRSSSEDTDEEITEEPIEDDWEEEDSETIFQTEADRLAQRASRSGLLGLILPILQLYTLWLLLLFCFEPSYATTKSRWLVAFAWVACLLGLFFLTVLIFPPTFAV